MTSGVTWGSTLRLKLCTASYDNLLGLDMPEQLSLVVCANDVVALVAERTVEPAKSTLDILMLRVSRRMTAHGFSLTLEKIEVVILIRKRIPTLRRLMVSVGGLSRRLFMEAKQFVLLYRAEV